MIYRSLIFAGFVLAITDPAHASARPHSPFSVAPVSDVALEDVRGTASPYAPLSRGTLLILADEQSQTGFRLGGAINNLQMAVWWGTIGSELIANAVRNQL
ncbi:MAG: hypothetical protein EOO77_09885 [Oxalobacteraceae bacterium]|nr:MAG: hypothetical protein EOO77_09885 [Oxalobacteraceae bacterium]